MASERESSSLIDLAAVLLSPVLVMLMVGSLVFFLIEVLYGGKYSDRLLYTFFFFVIGAVLIARIAIQFGYARASLYGAGLGGACFVAMMAFVEYETPLFKVIGPIINIGLMALVWWSANKLTWDCTHFDDAQKASGKGILGAAGIDADAPPEVDVDDAEVGEFKKKKKPPGDGFIGWWEKFGAYRDAQKKKPHTPGVWVLYFSLAALPLFALGQSLIGAEDADRRRATFLDMAVYIGSGLGLLVTTTLLGLRRYMEQRNAKLPTKMVAGWLGLGGALIVMFLVVGAILPRPHSETPWFGMKRAGGKAERSASKNAIVKDNSAGKGQGTEGKKTEAGDGKNSAKGGKQGSGNAGEKGPNGGKGDDKDSGGKQSNNKSNDPASKKNNDESKTKNDAKKSDSDSGGDDKMAEAEKGEEGKEADDKSDDSGNSDGSSSSSSKVAQALESVGSLIKWIVFAIVALAVIAGFIYFVLRGLAPFTAWAKGLLDWLKGLFGKKEKKPQATEDEAAADEAELYRPPPFETFSNPFSDGSAKHRTPAELVEFTFAALESWAFEHGLSRKPGETPMEFAVRVGHEFAELDEPGFRLAELYGRVLYSRSPLPGDALAALKAFWQQLESIGVRA